MKRVLRITSKHESMQGERCGGKSRPIHYLEEGKTKEMGRQWLSSIISASHRIGRNSYRDTPLQSNSEIFHPRRRNIWCKSDFVCTDKSDFRSWQIWFASSEMFDLIQESCPTWKYSAMANLVFSDKINCNKKVLFRIKWKLEKSFSTAEIYIL